MFKLCPGGSVYVDSSQENIRWVQKFNRFSKGICTPVLKVEGFGTLIVFLHFAKMLAVYNFADFGNIIRQ